MTCCQPSTFIRIRQSLILLGIIEVVIVIVVVVVEAAAAVVVRSMFSSAINMFRFQFRTQLIQPQIKEDIFNDKKLPNVYYQPILINPLVSS
jgi:hypothetical protein